MTGPTIAKIGLSGTGSKILEKLGLNVAIYDQTQPNPNERNVEDGLKVLKQHKSDVVFSIGGGSAHDIAKAIALVATNGGSIEDYEGVNKSKKKGLPLYAINTTAETASEMARYDYYKRSEED